MEDRVSVSTGSTISYAGIVGAGQTLPIALTGTNFYLTVATAPVYIRPTGVSPWSLYQPGTGINCPSQFSQLEVYNPTSTPVTFQIFAGYADFIDHRVVTNLQTQTVVNVLAPGGGGWVHEGGPQWYVEAPDLSGTAFNDALGNTWLAVQRQSINFQTVDGPNGSGSATFLELNVMKSLSNLSVIGHWVGPMASPAYVSASGPFLILSFDTITTTSPPNAYAFETYLAIAQGFQGSPPS
jgi:hypothetical protein